MGRRFRGLGFNYIIPLSLKKIKDLPSTGPTCPQNESPERADCALWNSGQSKKDLKLDIKALGVCPLPLPGSIKSLSLSPSPPRCWRPWWALEGQSPWPPTRGCRVSSQRAPAVAHAAYNDTQASRYEADSNFPFYLLVQGEPENLTGPQTSCQELLIRAEQYKECTRPPASELAGQSAQMESDRLKEESLT